jgi:aspartate aminotransferase-like enzyme
MGKVTTAGGAVVGAQQEAIAALTAGATVAIDATAANVFTLTPGEDETINVTGGTAGERLTPYSYV